MLGVGESIGCLHVLGFWDWGGFRMQGFAFGVSCEFVSPNLNSKPSKPPTQPQIASNRGVAHPCDSYDGYKAGKSENMSKHVR